MLLKSKELTSFFYARKIKYKYVTSTKYLKLNIKNREIIYIDIYKFNKFLFFFFSYFFKLELIYIYYIVIMYAFRNDVKYISRYYF